MQHSFVCTCCTLSHICMATCTSKNILHSTPGLCTACRTSCNIQADAACRESAGAPGRGQDCRLWPGQRDQVQTTLHRLCVHTLVPGSRGAAQVAVLQCPHRHVCNGGDHGRAFHSEAAVPWKFRGELTSAVHTADMEVQKALLQNLMN